MMSRARERKQEREQIITIELFEQRWSKRRWDIKMKKAKQQRHCNEAKMGSQKKKKEAVLSRNAN